MARSNPPLAAPPAPPAADRRALAALLLALAAWGGLFIASTSFAFDAERFFVLLDDAMISMAYGRNLVAGEGLVWVPGDEPVEGFSNPLWTAAMAAANALPLASHHVSLIVQLLGLALLGATVWRVRSLVRAHFPGAAASPAGWLPAAVLTGSSFALLYWAAYGMETALQALLAVLAVHFAYDVVFAGRDRHLALCVVFALAYLVRMDMALLIAVVGGWVALRGGFRDTARRRWLAGAAVLAAAVVGYQVFRLLYFDAWLPNTYPLKLGGVPLALRLPRGLDLLGRFLIDHALLAAAVLAGALADAGRRSRSLLPALVVLSYLAYSVWVGGDAFEPDPEVLANRFLAFVLPLAFVVAGDLVRRWTAGWPPARRRAALFAATAVLLVQVNGLWRPPLSDRWNVYLHLRTRPEAGSHALVLGRLRALEKLIAPEARVVTYWAGIPAFFGRYRWIDAYGYNDARIARRPVRAGLGWEEYRPGHVKADAEYLLALRPDAFFQLWDLTRLPVRWPRHHMRRSGYLQVGDFWLRRDSPYLLTSVPPAPER